MNKYLTFFLLIILLACNKKETQNSQKLFSTKPPQETGITFENRLEVNDSMNYFSYGYFYMGGGVAMGDLNQDGLQDLYFTGNMVSNSLYLNQGNLKFEDATSKANTDAGEVWSTGCTMADINADGLLDIYVSVSGKWADRKNICYINQGNDENGIPIFKNEALDRGIADTGYSIQSTFLDYDGDGDLDLLVANYEPTPFDSFVKDYKKLTDHVTWEQSDHLYENIGGGYFEDVTEKAGLLNFGLTVGIITSDFNNDGFTDIYLSNDFHTPDRFYINNGDGTFTDHLKTSMGHTAFYGMGVDAGDINGDGLLDLVQVDMTPDDNFRSKTNMSSMDITGFWNIVKAGFHYQYMYNTLQVNQGLNPQGVPYFTDLAKMDGLDKTDWSWSALFADYDNDGYKDLYITNGNRRDINNRDYFKWLERVDTGLKVKYKELSPMDLTNKMPFKKVDNYIFRNTGNSGFSKQNDEWGLSFEGFSNGAAYGDLDNDGDLELVINNVDSVALIFENHGDKVHQNNYVRVTLNGPHTNPLGIGTKLLLTTEEQNYYHEHTMVRGYQSSVEPTVHFGVGKEIPTSLKIIWPDGTSQEIVYPPYNEVLQVNYNPSKKEGSVLLTAARNSTSIFEEIPATAYHHVENDFDDYKREVLLPHRMSQLGPALAVADINGDGLEDFYVGGAIGQKGTIYLQYADQSFKGIQLDGLDHEDIDATFIDFDRDGLKDLYIVSGGNENDPGSEALRDRIYKNKGNGQFELTNDALPDIRISGGVVKGDDFDNDGDIDLFIGGRQLPGKYPMATKSLIIENISQQGEILFKDISDEVAPEIQNLGMVTDASWDDVDGDGDDDLLIVGEWMQITLLENKDGTFKKQDNPALKNTVGWWNTIKKLDIDHDGDSDFIVGNLGLNYKYKASLEKTFDVYANDYDGNGKLDIVLGYYQGDVQFPVRGKQCSSEQVPALASKFKSYNKFASSDLAQIYSQDLLDESIHYKAQLFSSIILENEGSGKFSIRPLPKQVQASAINDIATIDFNSDGHIDLLLGGNNYTSEVETPRNDACLGWLLQGNGQGEFTYIPNQVTGIYVPHDIRRIAALETKTKPLIIFANNDGPLRIYQ